MGQRRISMKKVREIIRLHDECFLSNRQIARAIGVSRPVAREYISRIEAAGLKYSDIKDLSDDSLLEILDSSRKFDERYEFIKSKFGYYAKELKRTGVTKQILWEEYKKENPHGYSYSQFCYHFQIWQNTSSLTMHIDHKAGDKLFVDFTGKKLVITDRKTGNEQEVEVFIGVLGASSLTYVEAVMSQQKEDWIRANENMLRYIGGVPRAIVPDCLKSAVTKADKYEPDINPEYMDFARHYNTAILPARPYRPKDKAMVEGAVKIVYSWIFAKIRNEVFYSLEELNAAIHEKLKDYNSRPMQRLKISRMDLFNEVERSELKELPAELYEFKKFKQLKVQFNYHIYLNDDRHYYSVPYRYKDKQTDVIYTDSVVDIYHNNIRIAFHKRDRSKDPYTTLPEHMPPNHRWKDDWNPGKIMNRASKKGEAVREVIESVLNSKKHPEQSYKTCFGILNLTRKYTNSQLNKACKRALYYENCSYKMIKNILANGMENMEDEPDPFSRTLPDHENIRGNNYYNQEII